MFNLCSICVRLIYIFAFVRFFPNSFKTFVTFVFKHFLQVTSCLRNHLLVQILCCSEKVVLMFNFRRIKLFFELSESLYCLWKCYYVIPRREAVRAKREGIVLNEFWPQKFVKDAPRILFSQLWIPAWSFWRHPFFNEISNRKKKK